MTGVYRCNMLLVLSAVCLLCTLCSCHSHDHEHGHLHDHHEHGFDERPSFKYSREANQPVDGHVHVHDRGHAQHPGHAATQDHAHHHVHDHDHAHHYGHDHSDDNDHAHEHGHTHGHDHDLDHDHDHHHDHGHVLDHGHVHDHGHMHDHTHDHGHTHGHVHDHDHHHDHDHDHGHTHDHVHDHGHGLRHGHDAGSAGEHGGVRYSRETDDDHGHVDDATVQRVGGHRSAADSGLMLWAISLGSTALISISPLIVLLLIPLENAREQQPLLKVLLSFASGGLLGDAFLHLIPHAIMSHTSSSSGARSHSHDSHGHSHGDRGHSHDSHGHSHSDHGHLHADDHNLTVGLWVLFGIVAFLAVEKFVRYVKGGDHHGHSHGAVHASDNGHSAADDSTSHGSTDSKKKTVKKSPVTVTDDKKNTSHSTQGKEDIKVAGYLNLAADFAHNFTDGLAIGASYAAGRSVGIITMVTILLHEVPHEVGDFAILMQSGCSRRKAMMLQLTTAVGALLGTVCSLLAEGIGNAATAWILPFTAGGFIYIATVSVIPELLQDSKIGQSVIEIVALVTGVAMMIVIAMYE